MGWTGLGLVWGFVEVVGLACSNWLSGINDYDGRSLVVASWFALPTYQQQTFTKLVLTVLYIVISCREVSIKWWWWWWWWWL